MRATTLTLSVATGIATTMGDGQNTEDAATANSELRFAGITVHNNMRTAVAGPAAPVTESRAAVPNILAAAGNATGTHIRRTWYRRTIPGRDGRHYTVCGGAGRRHTAFTRRPDGLEQADGGEVAPGAGDLGSASV